MKSEKVDVQLQKIVEEKEKILSEFKEMLYVLSHDLRSPLIIIQEFSKDLLINSQDCDEEELFSIKRIYENTRHLDDYLSGILEISRLFTIDYETTEFKTGELIDEIIFELKEFLFQKNEIVKKNMPTIKGKKQILRQIFKHLIKNAIIFGGTKIEISFDEKTGFFCVKDNGIGIEKTDFENIFKIGVRLKKVKVSGAGTGLAFCKKAVEKHNGKIFVKSQKNRGSEFFFSIKF